MSARHPNIKWADRKDSVLVTVMVQDCKDTKVDVTEDTLTFKGSNSYVTNRPDRVQLVRSYVVVMDCFFLHSCTYIYTFRTPTCRL